MFKCENIVDENMYFKHEVELCGWNVTNVDKRASVGLRYGSL